MWIEMWTGTPADAVLANKNYNYNYLLNVFSLNHIPVVCVVWNGCWMLIPFVLELIVNVKIKAKQVAITLLSPCQASSKNQKVDNRVWSVDCTVLQ